MYYLDGENSIEEELEVRDFIRDGEWDVETLRNKLYKEMTLHIMENITTPSNLQGNDLPRWMGKSQGNFSVKSTWNLVRQK